MSSSNPSIKTLTLTKEILRLISVLPISVNRGGESVYIKWGITYIMFVLWGTLIPSVGFFVFNSSDIMKVTESMYVLIGFSLAIVIPFCFLFDRMKIQHFFQEIECIVNERECWFFFSSDLFSNFLHFAGYSRNGYDFYAEQDAKIRKYSKRIVWISAVLTLSVTMRPLIAIVITYFNGNYTTESWQFLYPSMCVFCHSRSRRVHRSYLCSRLNLSSYLPFKISIWL